MATHHLRRHFAYELGCVFGHDRVQRPATAPIRRDLNLVQVIECSVDCGEVLLDYRLTLRLVRLLNRLLDLPDRFVTRQYA